MTKINFEFKKTDDRRNKDYSKRVVACASMQFIKRCDDEYYAHGFNVARVFEARLKALLPGLTVRVSRDSYERSERDWSIYISKKLKAEKPSKIVSDATAQSALPTGEIILMRIEEARTDTVEARDKHLAHTRAVRAASYVMEEQRKRLIEKTKVNTRFKQRLAALVAEHDAEYKALCAQENVAKAMVEELHKDNTEDDEEPRWSEACIALVGEHMDDYLAEHAPKALPSGFPRGSNDDESSWLRGKLQKDDEDEADVA
jgi:hypothetical protein